MSSASSLIGMERPKLDSGYEAPPPSERWRLAQRRVLVDAGVPESMWLFVVRGVGASVRG